MEMPCKKIIIDTIKDSQTFEIGEAFGKFIISHITVNVDKKYVMIRDNNNFKKIFHFVYSEIDVNPNTDKHSSMNVKNLI